MMTKKKASKAEIKRERDPEKVRRVIEKKGYKDGKLPQGKELHHVIPVSQGGKTTLKNTRVISRTKHKQIHENRREKGLE